MTPRRPEVVTVLIDLPQFEEPALMGTLRCQSSRTGGDEHDRTVTHTVPFSVPHGLLRGVPLAALRYVSL